MAQQTSVSSLLDMTSSSNVVFLGEAGSGKSEIALNFAQALAELGGKPVHFFDLDMTKPLFRSRDRREALEALGVEVISRPVASVENDLVRHNPGHLARELMALHAERNMRLVEPSTPGHTRNKVER